MPAIDSVTAPLVLRHADGNEQLVAACFPHPLGLLYLDAEGYPDLDDVERLRRAVDNLEEIQDMDVPGVDRATVATYLGDARRLLDRARRAKDKVQVQDKAKAKARATERGAGARAGDKR